MVSQAVAEVQEFSKDFARRRLRPSLPWATSTRQACLSGVCVRTPNRGAHTVG
jgi:hypothetical protein